MEDLFGVKMDHIMFVLLVVFIPSLAVIGFMALRNRVMLKMALRYRRHIDILHSQGCGRWLGHHR